MATKKSKVVEDERTRDWTDKVMVIDFTNALGERFHWEFPPNVDADSISTRPAGDDIILHLHFPIPTEKE